MPNARNSSQVAVRLLALCERYGLVLTAFLMGLIAYASLMPTGSAGDPGGADKLAHIVAYTVTVLPSVLGGGRKPVWGAVLVLIAGCAVEFLQPSFGRSFSIGDLVANSVGIVAALVLGTVATFFLEARGDRRAAEEH